MSPPPPPHVCMSSLPKVYAIINNVFGEGGLFWQHFHDESWRGSGYTFLVESTFCVSLFCGNVVDTIKPFAFSSVVAILTKVT
jgi:hypothetical protein